MRAELIPYVELIRQFVGQSIPADEFERKYLNLYKSDATDWTDEEFSLLDGLFYAVDAFCADPALRDERDTDEASLRQIAASTCERLCSMNP
jgi:hypothetical protein